jgi:outer membrane receptor for ferrienterochelin and colicins
MNRKNLFTFLLLLCLGLMLNIESIQASTDFDLGQIVVTGTKTEHTLGEVPVSVEVITQEEIQHRNITTVQDALDMLSGVKVTRTSGSWGNKGNIEMLGLQTKHTLILIDGQKIVGGHGGTDIQQISLNMIERIEVVKGPASALYGSEAVGGVVNIITKSGATKSFVELENLAGSRGLQKHSLSAGMPIGKVNSIINYSYNQTDGVNKATDEFNEFVLSGVLSYKFSPTLKFNFRPYFSEQEMKVDNREQKRIGFNSLLEWYSDEISKMSLRASKYNHEHFTGDKSTDWEDDILEIELNYNRLVLDNHNIIAGYHITKEEREDRGKPVKGDQTLNSFFVQDEIDLNPLTLVLGLRVDNHDMWSTQTNPKISMLYRLNENWRLRASAGTAFNAPPLVYLHADGWPMGTAFLVYSNPDLKPEESTGFQFGAEYRLTDRLIGEMTFFKNDIKNLIKSNIAIVGARPWNMYWINVDKAMTQGIELNLKTLLSDNLSSNISYTFLDTEDKILKKELTNKPKHSINFDLNYLIPVIEVLANFETIYTGKSYDDAANTDRLGGYTTYNLALSKPLNENFQVFTRFDNLGGKKDITNEYDIDGTEFLAGLRTRF